MNKERILELAEYIEALPAEQFNMGEWFLERGSKCGTVACVAGWAAIVFPTEEFNDAYKADPGTIHWRGHAQEALGLTYFTASKLFIPNGYYMYFGDQRSAAAKVLRHLAETGVVDWRVAEPEAQLEIGI